jgi:drug/metabolite transporter (DMT)-like permease
VQREGSRVVSLAALTAVLGWGASFVATRVALTALSPFALVAVRFAVGGAVVAAFARAAGQALIPPREGRARAALLGLILSAHLAIQAVGLQHTSAVNTAWIVGFIPVTIALGSRAFLGQRLGALAWLGVAVATGGVLLVTGSPVAGFADARLGDLLQLLSCLTWTAYTLLAVAPVLRFGSLTMTSAPMLVAAVVTAVAAVVQGHPVVGPLTPSALVAVAFLAVACSGLAYLLWFRALAEHGPARTGTYIYLEPFVNLGLAAGLLGEPVTLRSLLGGCAVLSGVLMVQLAGRRRKR